jgi:hypothetical protein
MLAQNQSCFPPSPFQSRAHRYLSFDTSEIASGTKYKSVVSAGVLIVGKMINITGTGI